MPTYNQAAATAECIRSLLAQSLPGDRYEVIVVDDGSTDETETVLEDFAGRVRTLRHPKNRGRSAARNMGIREARGRFIIFADSDVVVRTDFLEWHLRTHRKHGPGILSRGPVVAVPNPSRIRTARIPWFAPSPAYMDTANAAVERDVVIRAGLFDEGFPGYGWEDVELGMRLRRLGVRRVFCRSAAAFHIQPLPRPEALDALFEKEEARARSAVYLYRKHPTVRARVLIQATVLHRFLYWLMAGAGMLNRRTLPGVVSRLQGTSLEVAMLVAVRGVLNRHYLRTLAREFSSHAAGLA